MTDSAAGSAPAAQPASRRRARALFARIGAGAGLVACALGLGIIAGLGWAWLRPAYVGTAAHGGVAVDQIASPANVEFAALGWFSLLTAVIGAVLAAVALRQSSCGEGRGGVGTLVWLLVCGEAAAFAVYTTGNLVISLQQQGFAELADGESLQVVPPVSLGVAWLVGPFTAALSYWLANVYAFVSGDSAGDSAAETA
ncbi:hypothetical protein [Corynebacterium sp. HMSC071B10]|uniref:hypothetical protein n=1 Tax=Corynebacterium sp. HMSC071B10 TaxID=1739494 RepID=UPI0008A46165|nr:hypothetical protein [Corynebacterium sp. HMSC071B10]OFP35980.1 hypothetical protein HMPREF2990_07045 [Corynebacterium sp. HMSC071B10]